MTDPSDYHWLIRAFFAFAIVLGLMAAMAGALKYYATRSGFTLPIKKGGQKRLKIVESLAIDARRRLMIVRCDEQEHLLLLGGEDDIVIQTNLPPSETQH